MKLVVFDIDGTLADTKAVEDKCFMAAFEEVFGIDIRLQKWETLQNVTDWGITEEIIQQRFKRHPTEMEYADMQDCFVQKLKRERTRDELQFKEVEGANAFFHLLQSKDDFEVGIATGSWERSALVKLDAIGISPKGVPFSNSDYFKTREAITQDAITQAKRQSSAEFERIVYFGDGEWDYKTCRNLGVDFIGIDILGDGKLERLGAKHVLKDFREVERVMKTITK